MAITPESDKAAFWNRIRGDPVIQYYMGIKPTDGDEVAAQYILKRRSADNDILNEKTRFIHIFNVPARELQGPYAQSIVQVDVLMPSARQNIADMTMEQIIALCGDGWRVNGETILKVIPAGELASPAGYYKCGCQFHYHSCTMARPKTI